MKTNWMREAAYRRIPDLPWTAEPGTAPVMLGELMADVCRVCPVRAECAAFVDVEDIAGGYWTGHHREVPESVPVVEQGRVVAEQSVLFDGWDAA